MSNFIEFLFRFFGNTTIKAIAALALVCLLGELYKLFEQPFSFSETLLVAASALATHLALSIPENYIKLWLQNSSPQAREEA
jgi:hypothetical protein